MSDDPDLDATTLGRDSEHGGDALFQEVDVLNRHVRLDKVQAHRQEDRFKLRLKYAEVLDGAAVVCAWQLACQVG